MSDTESINNRNKEACAVAAHEMNRIFCNALGDYSQPRWEDAPQWQRDSAVVHYGMDAAGQFTRWVGDADECADQDILGT